MAMQMQNAVIVLADISGYTRFMKLHGKAAVHAESIITDLLESVIDHTEHPLVLNKLEGDAALFYALADANPQAVAESALHQASGFFHAFSTRKKEIDLDTLCKCGACTEAVNLHIKSVLNFGSVVVKRVRQFEEISGTSVIIAHRLLKNAVPLMEYVLLAEPLEEVLGGAPPGGTRITEQCEGIGAVNATYYPPSQFVAPPPTPNLMRRARLVINTLSYTAGKYIRGSLGVAPKREFRNLME
jgi:class 3 adenylate cyclase